MADPVIVVGAVGDFRRLYGDLSQAESRFGKLGAGIKAGLAGAAIAGTAALVKLGKDAVGSASEAQQSLGATESVFGRYADTVIRRSSQAADAVGLSANEYRELSNVTGAMLASAGTPLKTVATLTDQLNRRAADMAATFGGTTREAVEAVSSLLRGETDPIERYGVAIKQSDVNARLAAQGLDQLEGSALKQAEQQVRLELLFRQTAKAQGQFSRESDTLAGSQQRLSANVENLEAKFGELLLPMLTDASQWAGDELVPALEELADWLSANRDEFGELGATLKDAVLPVFSSAVEVGGDALAFFKELPGPLQEIAAQAGLAAIALPRLTSAASGAVGGLSGFVTSARNAETRTQALSSAARSAAGVLGLLALTRGAQESDEALQLLLNTAGGVATGFSAGGPWGALIGGGAVVMYELWNATRDTEEATVAGQEAWRDYIATLDDATASVTDLTKAQVVQTLQEKDLLGAGDALGVSRQTLVNGILGEEGARRKLNEAMKAERAAVEELSKGALAKEGEATEAEEAIGREVQARFENLNAIEKEVGAVRESIRRKREEVALVKELPKRVVTRIAQQGGEVALADVRRLTRQYDLTPKQVRTIVREYGTEDVRKRVNRMVESMRSADRTEVSLNRWLRGVQKGVQSGDKEATRGARAIRRALEELKADPNLRPYIKGITDGINQGKSVGKTGAQGVGDALESGLIQGLYGADSALSSRMAAIVRSGLAAARAAARSNSPSKETIAIGWDLARGFPIGTKKGEPALKSAGSSMVRSILAGVTGGTDGVASALEKVTALVEKATVGESQTEVKQIQKRLKARQKEIRQKLDGKAEDKALNRAQRASEAAQRKAERDGARARKAALKGLADEYAALRKNAQAQDRVNAKLDAARQKLSEVQSFVEGIRDAYAATGSVVSLGQLEDGTTSMSLLLDQLRGEVSDAKRFSVLIRQLTDDIGPKLNQTSLQQLIEAGPEAGLATAEALAAGGDVALRELNSLTAELVAEGTSLGARMSNEFFDAGLSAATALVKGLEADSRALDTAAGRLATKLSNALDAELRVKAAKTGGKAEKLKDQKASKSNQQRQRFDVRFTAEQLSAMQRGRAVAADLDAYYAVGGRRAAK